MNRLLCVALAAIVAAATSGSSAAAQSVEDPTPWLVGGSIGLPGVGSDVEPSLFTVAVHGTRIQSGQIGPDLFVGTMPRVLFEGVIALGARANLAWAAPISGDVLLLPGAGVSFIGGAGSGGGGAEIGANVGLSAIAFGESDGGVRVGMTWHRFAGANATIWLLEFGFVRRRD